MAQALMFALILAVAAPQKPASVRPIVGAAFPLASLALQDVDGRPIDPRDLEGRLVLVDVWATWCAPCLAELPTLRRLHERHRGALVVAGVSLDRMARKDFVAWLRRHDVRWSQHFDGRGYASPVAARLGISTVPASFLVATDGRVVARDLRGRALEVTVDSLVARLEAR